MLRQPRHLRHPREASFTFSIFQFFFFFLGNQSELVFNFKRMTFLASFHLNFLPLRMCCLLEVEVPSKVCVLTAWSSVACSSKCFREWGWRKQDTDDVPWKGVLSLILSCSTLPISMSERNFVTPPHSSYPTMVLGPASGPEASESSDHGLKP